MARTIRDFTTKKDVWPIVKEWAKECAYEVVESARPRKLYRRKHFLAGSPVMVLIESEVENVHLEVWVPANLFQRIVTLFFLPAEMPIESNYSGLTIPRKMARTAIDRLLKRFGQPKIP